MYDPTVVKHFRPPGNLVTCDTIHYTPPTSCPLPIRGTPQQLLPVIQIMTQAGMLVKVPRSQVRNTFPIFVVSKPDGTG